MNKSILYSLGLLLLATSFSYADDREHIEKLVRTQLMSWQTLSEAEFTSTVHSDLVFAYPGKRLNLEESLELFRFWADKFTNTKVYIHRVLIDGNKFSVEYQFASTRKSNGKRSVSGTVTVGEVKDGKILIWKEYLDGRVSRMQEKGELPLDEGAEPFPWPETNESK